MASSSRAAPKEQPAGTYNVDEGNALGLASAASSSGHLLSAADYIIGLLETNRVPYALMGGFALKLRGSPRTTHDVDLTVGCSMGQLIQLLTSQPR
jgi:hypothetical protein